MSTGVGKNYRGASIEVIKACQFIFGGNGNEEIFHEVQG